MNKRFDQLTKLSLLEWQLLLTSLILLPLVAFGLNFFGLRRTQQYIDSFTPDSIKTSLTKNQCMQNGETVARVVSIAANHNIYRANCLEKSLVICLFLRRYGTTANLRIGVNKENNILNAHSWVEINGHVLLENESTMRDFCILL